MHLFKQPVMREHRVQGHSLTNMNVNAGWICKCCISRPCLVVNETYVTENNKIMLKPPMRIQLITPGLQDQCSATELWRLVNYHIIQQYLIPV